MGYGPQANLFLTFSFFLILWGMSGYAGSKSAEIEQLDMQIEQLQDMKRGYEGRALRHEDQAEYLQFDQQAYLETRRHLQLASENRAKALMAQKEIDRLNAKREKLLK